MKNLDLISEELFNKIRGRFPSVTIGDVNGKVTNVPKDARYFDFDYKEGDTSLGKVSVSITDEAIEVMYSDNFVGEQDELTQQNWYGFLKELRQFSKKRLMKFDTRNINKSNLDRRDYEFLAANRGDNTMSESKMYGTNKLSYQNVDSARIVIKHTESVNPELGKTRTRNIGKIYIESADGERFLYPYKHLTGARAMARHVAEGGKPFDDFGTHIVGLSEEMNKLRKFKSYMGRSAVMAESLSGYMDVVKERIITVRKTIESLQKPKFYAETIAAYEKPMMEDVPSDVAENWVDQLTIRQFNEELKDVFPYIYNLVSEATKAKDITAEDMLDEGIDDVEVGAPAETYKVAPGDTLYSIYMKFKNANFQGHGRDDALQAIMDENPDITDPAMIQPGMVIQMPYFMGSGPDGSTRGLPGSFDKYGEEIENSFEDMMGQFADSMDEDVVEGFKKGDNVVVNDEQGYNDFSAPGKIIGLSSKGNRARIRFANNKTAIIPIGMLTPESVEEAKQEMCPEACCGKPVTECKCGPDCKHCDCHAKNKMNEAAPSGAAMLAKVDMLLQNTGIKREGFKLVKDPKPQGMVRGSISQEAIDMVKATLAKAKAMGATDSPDPKPIMNPADVTDKDFNENEPQSEPNYAQQAKDQLSLNKKVQAASDKVSGDLGDGFQSATVDVAGTKGVPAVLDTQSNLYILPNKGYVRSPAKFLTIQNGKMDTAMNVGPATMKALQAAGLLESIKESNEQKTPVTEFVLSMFDRESGQFPKGETAVLTAIEKDYGEQYIEPAKQFIERIQATFEQYAQPVQEPMIDEEPEGTVMEPTIEQDEEIGESGKDKYSKAEKKTEAQEIRELGDRLMKLAGL